MQVVLEKIAAGGLATQLESHFRDVVIGNRVVDAAQPADTGDIGHGFDIKDQDGIQ